MKVIDDFLKWNKERKEADAAAAFGPWISNHPEFGPRVWEDLSVKWRRAALNARFGKGVTDKVGGNVSDASISSKRFNYMVIEETNLDPNFVGYRKGTIYAYDFRYWRPNVGGSPLDAIFEKYNLLVPAESFDSFREWIEGINSDVPVRIGVTLE